MILSLNWLKELVDLEGISSEEIAKRITLSTAEIEEVTTRGTDMQDVVVAKVVTASKLENTNHLNLLSVDDGSGALLQIVTGAPNVYAGMKTALVRVGGSVAGHQIKKAKLAGIDSFGMCCSEEELGIGSDNTGIVDFSGTDFEVGADLKSILPIEDTLIEIDNKSLTNRPDLWGHLGFARELSAIFKRKLKRFEILDLSKLEGLPKKKIEVLTDGCKRYSALSVANVTKKVSPYFMKIRLNYCGLRDINLLADLTNYLMLEVGLPMHAFDNGLVNGVIVRESKAGEVLETLEGEKHILPAGTIVIADEANEPVAIAGIKGGKKSGITENTNSLFIESAVFEASKIRKASRAIGLSTDASLRYEKSLDPELTPVSIARLVWLLKNIDDGIVITSALSDSKNYVYKQIVIDFDTNFARKRIGVEIPNDKIVEILTLLGFDVKVVGENALKVGVPSYRATKDISIREDLVEEIARMYGYDNIVPETLKFGLEPVDQSFEHILEYKTKVLLAEKYDISEVHSYVWNYADFNNSYGIETAHYLELKDSSNSGQSGIRSELLPTLLKFYVENKNNFKDIRMEEIGRVITGLDENNLGIEEKHLAILLASQTKTEAELYFELKKIILNIAGSYLCAEPELVVGSGSKLLSVKESCGIEFAGEKIGVMGVVNPAITQKMDKKFKVCALELNFAKLAKVKAEEKPFVPVTKYQGSEFDYNFLVDEAVRFADIEKLIKEFKCKFNVEYALKDIYRSESLSGKKSVTINVVISSSDHTLSAKEIDNFNFRFLDHMKRNGITLKS